MLPPFVRFSRCGVPIVLLLDSIGFCELEEEGGVAGEERGGTGRGLVKVPTFFGSVLFLSRVKGWYGATVREGALRSEADGQTDG